MTERGAAWTILALWAAGLGAAAQYAKVSVIFGPLGAVYPQAGAALGWVVSMVGLVGIALGVVAGVAVARIGGTRALIGGLWLGAALSAMQALLPPLPVLLALRALEGLSHLAIVVAAPTLIATLAPARHRGAALTLWGTFFGVAFAVLTWLGVPLAQRHGVAALFLAHAAYMALWALVLWRRLGPPPPRGAALGDLWHGLPARHAALYRDPAVAAPGLGWLFYTFCFVSILTVLPPLISPEVRALTLTAFPLVAIVASLTLGVWLLRHRPAVWVVRLGFGLGALAVVWVWAWPGAPLPVLALSAAMGLIQGASFAAVPQLNPAAADQSRANGAMAQMGNLGNTLGTPVMAAALAQIGPLALPLLAGLAMLAGLAVHGVLARRRDAP